MLTVLIVEDELLSRIGLRSLVDWEALGFSLLEDAVDGLEALQRIRAHRPHIILLDINIPGLDGLSLLRQMREEGIDSTVIIISCYDDFDTVRKAMKLGAMDYVRKLSLEQEELTAVLQAARQSLSERGELVPQPDSSPKLTVRDLSDSEALLRFLPGEFETGYCVCVSILWNSFPHPELEMVSSICGQFLKTLQLECRTVAAEDNVFLLVGGPFHSHHAKMLHQQLAQTIFAEIRIGVSCGWSSFSHIPSCVQMADAVNTLRFYDGVQPVFFLERIPAFARTCPFDFGEFLGRLDIALLSMEIKELRRILSQLFQRMGEPPYSNLGLVRRMFSDLLSRFSACAQTMGGAIEEVELHQSTQHLQALMEMRTLGEAEQWFLQFAELFVAHFFTRSKSVNSRILQQALDYIDNNLSHPIQLGETARHVNVSGPYLSSLFKRELGENFIPFVNKRKIEEAKKLLSAGKLVYQASELLGFENSSYFSKVFKKYVGCTPESYRRRI